MQYEADPDQVYSFRPETTFVYTLSNKLYLGLGDETHFEDMGSNHDLKKDIHAIAGERFPLYRTNLSKYAVLGRIGPMPAQESKGEPDFFGKRTLDQDQTNFIHICAFWNTLHPELFKPCINELMTNKKIHQDTYLSFPPWDKIQPIDARFDKIEKQHHDFIQQRMNAIHLQKGDDKKQALYSMGAKDTPPASAIYKTAPGQKYWALNSENLNFKNWLYES